MNNAIERLFDCFENSDIKDSQFIVLNENGNVIADFRLEKGISSTIIKCKILEWFSKPAYSLKNIKLRKKLLKGINLYLGTKFSEKDIEKIYYSIGNGKARDLTLAFIGCNYNLKILC